jgi:hypothetical protein
MGKDVGDTTENKNVEACKQEKKHRRRRILYNLFDFLAIVTSMLSLIL